MPNETQCLYYYLQLAAAAAAVSLAVGSPASTSHRCPAAGAAVAVELLPELAGLVVVAAAGPQLPQAGLERRLVAAEECRTDLAGRAESAAAGVAEMSAVAVAEPTVVVVAAAAAAY